VYCQNFQNVNITTPGNSNFLNKSFKTGVANPNWSLGRNLEILSKILTFWAAIYRKTEETHPKLRKIADSQFKIGPQKFLFGPHAARGPRVGHPCFKTCKIVEIFYIFSINLHSKLSEKVYLSWENTWH
jgi:hypothetical protein